MSCRITHLLLIAWLLCFAYLLALFCFVLFLVINPSSLGFLGSGKTTLIQYILHSPNHRKRIAVIENEFGEGLKIESLIARDGTVRGSTTAPGNHDPDHPGNDDNNERSALIDLIELPNGCVCCTVKDSLVATLEQLVLTRRRDLDYILIECSGMANPGPIASLFWLDDALESRLRLDGIVTLVDAKHIAQQLNETMEAAQQIAYADRIVLNKIDLLETTPTTRSGDTKDQTVAKEAILQMIRAIHPTAPLRETTFSQVPDLNWILDAKCFDADRVQQVDRDLAIMLQKSTGDDFETLNHSHDHDHHDHSDGSAPCSHCVSSSPSLDLSPVNHRHTSSISTVAFVETGTMDLRKVNQWLATILWPNQDEKDQVLTALLQESMKNGVSSSKAMADATKKQPGQQEIFRIKGILSVYVDETAAEFSLDHVDASTGIDSRRYIVQAVHDLWEIHPASHDLKWRSNDAEEPRECKVVIIGRSLDEANLRAGFRACLI